MRCRICGWDNAPDAETCVKCGQPIQNRGGSNYNPNLRVGIQSGSPASEPGPRPTVMGVSPSAYTPRPTVAYNSGMMDNKINVPEARETRVMGATENDILNHIDKQPSALSAGQSVRSGERICPDCGHPLPDNSTTCLFCGAYVGGRTKHADLANDSRTEANISTPPVDVHVTCPNCKEKVSAKYAFCPMCGTSIKGLLSNTLDVKHIHTGPKCSLTVIPDEDEQSVGLTNYYYFEDSKPIVLNRDNTEMSNRTITSKEQAILVCEEGKWYIENRSEQQSSYFELNRRLELLSGDIVMLGDRRFKFSIEDYDK